MKSTLEIELDRQIFRPGEHITGKIHFNLQEKLTIDKIILSLQGEEILGANSITRSVVMPLVNEQHVVLSRDEGQHESIPEGTPPSSFPIEFRIPDTLPPSYASEVVKCLYFIKGQVSIPWARDIIEKMHITVIPYAPREKPPEPVALVLEEESIKMRIELEKDSLMAGETLTGSLSMEYIPQEVPEEISFEIRAREKSLDESYTLDRTIWSLTRESSIKDEQTGYLVANFEFPTPPDAPFSHRWNTFEITWEFRVTVRTFNRKELSLEKSLTVNRLI
ncbi:MAG: hypothetical protein RDV48_03720 [Candidatus Eremiobacteraeota bacterium]|nr:hypothetical protein [Candidatus Eremiobacteraeota bacterium]